MDFLRKKQFIHNDKYTKSRLSVLVISLFLISVVQAKGINERNEEITLAAINIGKKISRTPEVTRAVLDKNQVSMSITEIEKINQRWISNPTGSNPNIAKIMNTELSSKLKKKVKALSWYISEIFVTDSKGRIVAMSSVTSDYYQGDEEKWIRSFNDGNGQLFVSQRVYDESTSYFVFNVATPIFDSNNQTIGVVVLGIKYDRLN
jgi:hypothetical protein